MEELLLEADKHVTVVLNYRVTLSGGSMCKLEHRCLSLWVGALGSMKNLHTLKLRYSNVLGNP
jgi:hypothetical protein